MDLMRDCRLTLSSLSISFAHASRRDDSHNSSCRRKLCSRGQWRCHMLLGVCNGLELSVTGRAGWRQRRWMELQPAASLCVCGSRARLAFSQIDTMYGLQGHTASQLLGSGDNDMIAKRSYA